MPNVEAQGNGSGREPAAACGTGDAAGVAHRQRLQDGQDCLAAALDYRKRGWSVLIVCPPDHAGVGKGHGRGCTSPGKAPWGPWKSFQEQLPTEAGIRQRWKDLPTGNVGIALGPVSGLVRVDVDGNLGEQRLREVSGGDLPPTLEFTSGGGGRGLLYRIPAGVDLRTTPEKLGKKQELRFQAKGAQTVLPPSRHVSGRRYEWKGGHGPDEIEPAIAPGWLVRELQAAHASGRKPTGPAERVAELISEGGRNDTLASLAGSMRRRGMSEDAIFAGLQVENDSRCSPPLPEEEVRRIARSVAGYSPGAPVNGRHTDRKPSPDGRQQAEPGDGPPDSWEPPIPLATESAPPDFPAELLPGPLARWVEAEAEATQTPPDLAGALVLAIAGGGLAGKVRVIVRQGWMEPTNLFTVVALPPGDRKSAVFAEAQVPVQEVERQEQERMAPIIAELASAHRVMEKRLKGLEEKAAKAEDQTEAAEYRQKAKELARELAAHQVPDLPEFYCDDTTPEKLTKLLARQGGRMLQASAEGTAFEIAKGRYSETANFDVYLKGHAGDPLRVGRISRDSDTVDRPALSVALAVQPDVINGLADQASMRGRGFLARFLFAIPASRVGRRSVAPAPVPAAVAGAYQGTIKKLWELPGLTNDNGKPEPYWLRFSAEADRALRTFEAWLEPQLAEGENLSHLAG
jgi:hypothetical protein